MNLARPLLTLLAASLLAMTAMPAPAASQTTTAPPATTQAGSQVFYQIFFRSFRDSNGDRIGDLKGLTSKLGYIKHLGATTILLTPLQPSPYYHNYFATAFKAIDPAYGTMADYFAFIRAAHAQGLKVYLDEEFQYVAEGNPWWRKSICKPHAKYADYLLWKDASHCVAEPFMGRAKWLSYTGKSYGIAMVNLDNPAVKAYFQKLLLFWADPHGDGSGHDGVDGFRLDHMMDDLDHKGLDKDLFAHFWAPIIHALKARRPDLGILAEQADWGYGTKWLTQGHVNMVFAFPLRGALLSLDKQAIVKAIRATDAATPAGKHQVIFLENHDVDRSMSLFHDDQAKARAAAAIELMLKGDPLIYYGQELGMRGMQPKNFGKSGGIPLSDGIGIPVREAFRWQANLQAPGSAIWYEGSKPWWPDRYNRSNDGVSLQEEKARPDSLYHWYRKLLALRQARAELREGSQRILCDDNTTVLCILREDGSQRTLLLVNLGKTDAKPRLDPKLTRATTWTDLLGNHATTSPDATLQPMQVRIVGTPE
ncbi:alpha-amylase family glycosyl hydrolase [Rhodanobacter sp. 115]|uniref:alpha-amylase family glycosyl hydrolase n=1 Tax=Rhodanobacter sp. FW021-MT20 TaxID=1162282 RepID=UPI000260FCAF|nr:alpha-amylase family glycosyl hydrolase [Rhodanobacter sp. 115]EIL93919.1 alpha amylase [Rhodanobacter sp. 115]